MSHAVPSSRELLHWQCWAVAQLPCVATCVQMLRGGFYLGICTLIQLCQHWHGNSDTLYTLCLLYNYAAGMLLLPTALPFWSYTNRRVWAGVACRREYYRMGVVVVCHRLWALLCFERCLDHLKGPHYCS
jgi:hypothetical protein